MLIDFQKMRAARDRRALTQEALAHQARVNVRTIQRAENGEPVRHETLADIAAVLGVPVAALVRGEEVPRDEPQEADNTKMQMLKRVDTAESVIGALERAAMAILGCIAAPTDKNMPVLREVIGHLEALIGHPYDEEATQPLSFGSLLLRLEAVAALNRQLADLEREGLALYSAVSTEYVKIPRYGDEGFYTSRTQKPQYVTAARFLIAEYQVDRIRVPSDVIWPLEREPEPSWGGFADDLDDDIPF